MKNVFIDASGALRFVWNDELHELTDLGEAKSVRVSDVEMYDGAWVADLSRIGGPRLEPCVLRADAVRAEIHWLNKHMEI